MEDSTRPLIGFPLGLALLLILLLCMSAFFYCCFQWEKLRSLFISSPDDNISDIEADLPNSPRKPLSPHKVRTYLYFSSFPNFACHRFVLYRQFSYSFSSSSSSFLLLYQLCLCQQLFLLILSMFLCDQRFQISFFFSFFFSFVFYIVLTTMLYFR